MKNLNRISIVLLMALTSYQVYGQTAVITSFVANETNEKCTLIWSTSEEYNNKGFEIERSLDAVYWESIGFVTGQVKSSDYVDYQFYDFFPEGGTNYYRLKQISENHSVSYSIMVSICTPILNQSIGSPSLAISINK
jgi:hypothetical protein